MPSEPIAFSMELLEITLQSIGDAVIVTDASGRVTRMSSTAEHLTGWPARDAIARPLADVFRTVDEPARAPIEDPPCTACRTGCTAAASHTLLIARDGTKRSVADCRTPIRDATGAMRGVVVVFRDQSADVAARKARERTEGAIRRAQGQLQAVLDCAPAIILAVDREGRIQFVNKTMSQRCKEDVIGAGWLDHVPAADRPRVASRLQAVLATGRPQRYEVTSPGPDGTARTYQHFMGPMREGNVIVGAVIVAQDATEQLRAATELAAAQRLAAVGTLAAGIAHEINTPVQFVNDSLHFLRDAMCDVFALVEAMGNEHLAVTGHASQVQLDAAAAATDEAIEAADLRYLHDRVPRAFERCIEGLERVATIVRSMKEFAHPAQKAMSPTDLNRAIQSTLVVARNEYKYVAELATELGELPLVTCHVNDINQVVLNIVVNAAHAIGDVVKDTGQKGTITVRTLHEDDTVVIAIADTGGGIPETIRDRIFDPFFTTKGVGRGTGQGLAIARTIINEKHAGSLTFEAKRGEGTTFFIRLPVHGKRAQEGMT